MTSDSECKVEKDICHNSYCSAMHRGTGLQFYYVKADTKQNEKHIQQNTVNAIVIKLQVIYSTVRT